MSETPDEAHSLSTRAELETFVANHDRALVEFYTEGCGVCAAMEPVLSGVARTSDVAVATMNPREDPQLVEEYDVRSVPKLLAFVGGALVETREDGFLGVEEVNTFLDAARADAPSG
jgi:thioredoxin 1